MRDRRPPTAEDQCERCGRLLDCSGNCPQHGTETEQLTGEQIDYFTGIIRECAADDQVIMPRTELVDAWLAAVIARAKREERERIARYVGAQLQGDLDGCYRFHDDCPACRALQRATNYLREACTPDDPPTCGENAAHRSHR